jgi:hypothetical protein
MFLFPFLYRMHSTTASSRLEVCLGEDVFLGRLETGFFFFSELAITLASRNSRSLSVSGFLVEILLDLLPAFLEETFLTGTDFDLTVFFAADEIVFFAGVFLTTFLAMENVCCLI